MNPQIVDIFDFDGKALADTNSWEMIPLFIPRVSYYRNS